MNLLNILLILLAAGLFGWVLQRLYMPGGMMVGAVIGACLANLLLKHDAMPWQMRYLAQSIAGGYIGSGLQREDLRHMRGLFRAFLIVILCLLAINIVAGLLIYRFSSLDPLTALLSVVPGGISETPIVAEEMGADVSKVLVLQFVRLLMGIGLFPTLIGRFTEAEAHPENRPGALPAQASPVYSLPTLAVAFAFGLLGRHSGVSGGTLAFAAVGSMALKLAWPKAGLVKPMRHVAQGLSGAVVGAGIGIQQIRELPQLALPAVILLICYILGALCIGWLLMRFKLFSPREAYLAATPAGASDMTLISADLGVYNIRLILLQILRMMAVITVFPSLLRAIARMLGG